MSMFTITGQVLNTFDAPDRKDEKGDVLSGKPKVQLLGEMPMPGGQKRFDMVTLTCEDPREYQALIGKTIRVPMGMFSPARGQVLYFIPKGGKPELANVQA